ncbi:histidine kinase [Streptomyces sp. ACA25]|uniref:sensor histidine kinase n=1 Tax=Streptomyces sp. ACA25 TaxID=3022596 RepID=UPI0023081429|nr:histidine kinase [Streptomyces sp. ACA25]MDB1087216.1 histidine kinase [Streptomyces sp. ACA25]
MTDTGADRTERQAGWGWWPRRRSAVLDAGLATVSALECALQGLSFAQRTGLPVPLVVGLGALAGGSLIVRRQWPVAVILVAIAVVPAQMGSTLAMIGLYTLATTEAPRRIIAALAGMVGAGVMIIMYLAMYHGADAPHAAPLWFTLLVASLFAIVSVVPPVLLGMYVRARRRLVESLRERADGLERELALLAERAEERAEWARREERTRIAREMHDVVAHRVSLMVVHAAALQAVALRDPQQASKNAELVGDMGRQALTELRTMLGVLRTEDRKPVRTGPAGPGEDSGAGVPGVPRQVERQVAGPPVTDRVEGPSLGELAALVEQSRDAGMVVELAVEGEPRLYGAHVERTAFRLVQEALTNVHKHASGAEVRVRVAHRAGEVAVLVQNEAPAGAEPGSEAGMGLPSGGNGLLGMRERVSALGGGFVSGPTEAGGFRVSAVIPDGRPEPVAG